jgi:hypothetical protein
MLDFRNIITGGPLMKWVVAVLLLVAVVGLIIT